jgi:P4 family phage/plasmid primase-like protien
VHAKFAENRWAYRHKVPKEDRTTPFCPEHEGSKLAAGGWCHKIPAAADNLMWNMPDLVPVLGDPHGLVLWCAGEKDADCAQRYADKLGGNVVATTVHQGEARTSTLTEGQRLLLVGAECEFRLYYDRDLTGIRNVLARYDELENLGVSRIVIRALPGEWLQTEDEADSPWFGVNDLSDLFAQGGSLRQCETVEYEDLKSQLPDTDAAFPDVVPGSGSEAGVGVGGSGTRSRAAWEATDTTGAEGVSPRVAALVRAVRAVRPDATAEIVSGKVHISCPLGTHEDNNPSFSITEGKSGGILLTCTCDPTTGRGADRIPWLKGVLAKLKVGPEYVVALHELDRADDTRARVFSALNKGRLLYVRETQQWIHWDAKRGVWSADEDAALRALRQLAAEFHKSADCITDEKAQQAMHSFAVNGLNASKIRETLGLAAKITGMSVSIGKMDANPDVLTFKNGTLVMGDRGAVFREHRSSDMCRLAVPHDYDPDATNVNWDIFLEDVMPKRENREYLQRVMGYCMLGGNPDRMLFFITGPTSTGKTTFTNIIMNALGAELSGPFQLSMFRTKRDDAPRPDILKAMPRRLIVAEEGSSEWNLHADVIKAMTSGGRIEARGMRSNEYAERIPAFTPVLCTNEWPEIKHADRAVKRRVTGIPFVTQIERAADDIYLVRKITPDYYRAVLAWLVHGWELYAKLGLEGAPYDVRNITAEIHDSMSPVDQFIQEMCTLGEGFSVEVAELYREYRNWWDEAGKHGDPQNAVVFGREVNERTETSTKPKSIDSPDQSTKSGRTTIRMRYGIKLDVYSPGNGL